MDIILKMYPPLFCYDVYHSVGKVIL